MKLKYLLVLIVIITGCQKLFFSDDPKDTPENNFEIFWNDFDRYYVYFNYENIDWDSVYAVYRPQITSNTSGPELFAIFSNMTSILKDGHVDIHSPYGYWGNNKWWSTSSDDEYSSGSRIIPDKYLLDNQSHGKYYNIVEYNDVKNHNIGYILLKNFSGEKEMDESYFIIDDILKTFRDKDGIIIDVRFNGGGSSFNAMTIASRFTDKKRLSCKERFKSGPGKNDFSEWVNGYIEPKGVSQYSKPVVVLTSRKSFSASEEFILYMKVLPQVILVGDTTGGGLGPPIRRELPNGFSFRLSASMVVSADEINYQGKGIPPDIAVQNTNEDIKEETDRMLENGIEIIENKIKTRQK